MSDTGALGAERSSTIDVRVHRDGTVYEQDRRPGDRMQSITTAAPREQANREETATSGVPPVELRRAGLTALALLTVLNIADVVITRLLIARGGIELNPVADRLLASNLELVAKLAIVVVLTLHFVRRGPRLSVICFMWLVAGVYVCVVIINGSQLVAVWNS